MPEGIFTEVKKSCKLQAERAPDSYESQTLRVMTTHRVHHGHNIKRLREIQGVKQTTLALELGEGWSQKKVSMLESRPTISPELLQQVAAALGLSAEAIEHFQESAVCKQLTGIAAPPPNGFMHGGGELVEKLLELLEENRALYHCLLDAEKEKNQLLERMLAEKSCQPQAASSKL